ncbi:MAG: YopX family protein [Candidatus Azobacteroides sp.]|nr:YopX family protein [Candidatus Azobacteroides sp.]
MLFCGKREYGKFGNFHPDNIWWAGDTPANWDEVIGNIYDNPELLNNE